MKIYWKTAADGSFGTAGNWNPAQVPGAADIAEITATGSAYTVTVANSPTVLGIVTSADATLFVQGGTFINAMQGTAIGANRGLIDVDSDATLVLGGTVNNIGTIQLLGAGTATQLNFLSGATLKGGGLIATTDNSNNQIDGAFTNVDNSIAGAGTIAAAIHNQKAGVINASLGSALTLSGSIANAGELEATGDGGLAISTTVTNTSTGVISAASSKTVGLVGAIIRGGTLTGDGEFDVTGDATLDGGNAVVPTNTILTLASDLTVQEGSNNLTLLGTINNTGHITVAGIDSPATLIMGAAGKSVTVTLKRKGVVTLDGAVNSRISGAGFDAPAVTLMNVDNTIEGTGIIGGDGLKLNNGAAGVIDALFFNSPLIIDTADRTITNAGKMQAEPGAELVIASPLSNTGMLLSSGVQSLVLVESTSTGGSAIINGTGLVEFGAATTTGVKFAVGATGQLMLDDSIHYKGTVSGFGQNTTQSIDLVDVAFTGSTTKSFAAGVLTVNDHAGDIAHIKFAGSFTLASFKLQDDGHGGTLITDPPVAKSASSDGTGFGLPGLFAQHIASSFPTLIGSIVSNAWMEASHAANPQPLLAHPHA